MRAPLEITLVRGRTEPLEAGRAATVALLLEEEVLPESFALLEGLLPVDGLLPDEGVPLDEGLELVGGLAPVDGVLVFGGAGFSAAGGTFACATGASLYERL